MPPRAAGSPRKLAYGKADFTAIKDTFVLYRIIGNDIVPRHGLGQSRANLEFILLHEAHFANCEKRWIVNRIVDPGEESSIVALLESRGQPYIHIPFDPDEYARVPFDLDGLPSTGYLATGSDRHLPRRIKDRLWQRIYRHKNNYVMNNNGARNAALSDGRKRAKWVLPWDGNCFVTTSAWQEILVAVKTKPELPYLVVPMIRTTSTEELRGNARPGGAKSEPQVAFRADAAEAFDENYYYGRRPKVELLWRLGVPGPWDDWTMEPWDLPCPDYSADAGLWHRGGWVARLPSGRKNLDVGRSSTKKRQHVRTNAVVSFLQRLDAGLARSGFLPLRKNRPYYLSSRDDKPLRDVWSGVVAEIPRSIDRPGVRPSRSAISLARAFLLEHHELPRLIVAGQIDRKESDLRRLYRWVRNDPSAVACGKSANPEGSVYDAFYCALCVILSRFNDLTKRLVIVADRARMLFEVDAVHQTSPNDPRSRIAWQCLDRIAAGAGSDLWAGVNPPEWLLPADRADARGPEP